MKNIKITIVVMFSIMIYLAGGFNTMGQEKNFRTPEEAIKKARADMTEILQSTKEFNFGVTADQLKKARQMPAVQFINVDFNKLLQAEEIRSFSELSAGNKSLVAPLAVNSKILTTVEVAKRDNQWYVVGFADKTLAESLNSLPTDVKEGMIKNVKIFEVPNLNTRVFVLNLRAEEICYTDYEGFSMKEGVPTTKLLEVLVNDAREFQAEFGDIIKEKRLVD